MNTNHTSNLEDSWTSSTNQMCHKTSSVDLYVCCFLPSNRLSINATKILGIKGIQQMCTVLSFNPYGRQTSVKHVVNEPLLYGMLGSVSMWQEHNLSLVIRQRKDHELTNKRSPSFRCLSQSEQLSVPFKREKNSFALRGSIGFTETAYRGKCCFLVVYMLQIVTFGWCFISGQTMRHLC